MTLMSTDRGGRLACGDGLKRSTQSSGTGMQPGPSREGGCGRVCLGNSLKGARWASLLAGPCRGWRARDQALLDNKHHQIFRRPESAGLATTGIPSQLSSQLFARCENPRSVW
jgi:hypothetical protein